MRGGIILASRQTVYQRRRYLYISFRSSLLRSYCCVESPKNSAWAPVYCFQPPSSNQRVTRLLGAWGAHPGRAQSSAPSDALELVRLSTLKRRHELFTSFPPLQLVSNISVPRFYTQQLRATDLRNGEPPRPRCAPPSKLPSSEDRRATIRFPPTRAWPLRLVAYPACRFPSRITPRASFRFPTTEVPAVRG